MSPKIPVVYAFIDSQNLNLGVKSQGWNLDFTRFRRYLSDKYKVTKAFLFIGYVPGNENLYQNLQDAGYLCVFKNTLEHKAGKKVVIKGNVDAELVLHSMIEYNNYDQAIIVSGDGDFRCVVEYLHNQNKLYKLIVPNHKYSSLLREYASHIVSIQLIKEKVKQKAKKREAFPRDKTLR